MANVLLVFNRNPYDGTDVTWNGLRLAEQLINAGLEVNMFLMNDSVDLARDVTKQPEGYFDLGKMLKELIGKNVPVKVCGTCKVRCGIHKGEPYFEGAQEAKMTELAEKVCELGDLAEKYCLVSRSVACPVHYELEVKTIGKWP